METAEAKKETKKKFKPIVFISEARGLQPMDEKGKPICKFTPFSVTHPDKGQISKGHYVCVKKAIYDKLTAVDEDGKPLYGFNKDYKQAKNNKLPRETNRFGMIIRGVNTASSGKSLSEMNETERLMIRELGQLEAKYYTEESKYTVFKGNIKDQATKDGVDRRVSEIKKLLGR
jgi:hypothetical protein